MTGTPVEVTGTVTLSTGETVSFRIGDIAGEISWQKWGAPDEVLYLAGDIVEAMTEAARAHLTAPDCATCGHAHDDGGEECGCGCDGPVTAGEQYCACCGESVDAGPLIRHRVASPLLDDAGVNWSHDLLCESCAVELQADNRIPGKCEVCGGALTLDESAAVWADTDFIPHGDRGHLIARRSMLALYHPETAA